jgi:hypothetical protein
LAIFISYSHADAAFVEKLSMELIKHNVHVWILIREHGEAVIIGLMKNQIENENPARSKLKEQAA